METNNLNDGIHGMVPRDKMAESARKLRDIYEHKPGVPFYQREFGYMEGTLEKWADEGMPKNISLSELFKYDEPGEHSLGQLGWTEAAFSPIFEEKVIEDRGQYEVVQDFAGRHLLCFKGRRQGFMPEYLEHPVKDIKTWEENCKWRLDPNSPERYADLDKRMKEARKYASKGFIITQNLVGGYMYLRSLIGPGDLLYMFYDNPDLIHECMKTWFELADTIIAKHQQYVTLDQIFIGEDICYNNGPLISPDMIKEFLFPYYQQLITNIKKRQIDKNRHLYFQVDTDGYCVPVIPLYKSIGMDVISPLEVASGCDVVKIAKEYPDLVMIGGIDKRILAKGKKAIDEHLDYILPFMYKNGGYIPNCDHAVPNEVSYEDYLYYRNKVLEYNK